MKRKIGAYLYLIGIVWLMLSPVLVMPATAINSGMTLSHTQASSQSIIIIAVDKLDSQELFNTNLPGLHRLLLESGIGLMNIRTGAGYTGDYSGFLTLGTGTRSIFPGDVVPNPPNKDFFFFKSASNSFSDYLKWNTRNKISPGPVDGNAIPEFDWIINQAELKNYNFTPGLLGTLLHQNGWQTVLLGNGTARPGASLESTGSSPAALMIMDQYGQIDQILTDQSLTDYSPDFPFTFHFSPAKAFQELKKQISAPPHPRLITVEFTDFALLNEVQGQMTPTHYTSVKQGAWRRLNGLVTAIINQWDSHEISLVLTSASISNDGVQTKNLLAPIVIRDPRYPPGLLATGTTKWPGLVANIDFLPTVLKIADIKPPISINGRALTVNGASQPLTRLKDILTRVLRSLQTQRSLLDWYLGIISLGWIAGLLFKYFKKSQLGNWLITGVAVIPIGLLILPQLDLFPWNLVIFLALVVFLSSGLSLIHDLNLRFFVLTGVTWGLLLIDQLSGWNLIRLSALGYSPTAGSRYYGMGNEYMGTFLAAGLILAYLVSYRYQWRWAVYLILGSSVLILGWPQFGANFGGLLAALPGLTYLVMKTGHFHLGNRRFWSIVAGGICFIVLIGWWDSFRGPENQTHIGRFFQLFFTHNFSGVFEIILRKLDMNLKLLLNSSWTRIIGLTGLICILNRIIFRKNFVCGPDRDVWFAILLTSIAAFLFNDSGVVACATCLALAFSFFIAKWEPNSQTQAAF